MERLLTAKEVSISLNLPLQRIYDLTRRGAIPAVQIFRQYRYDPAAISEWAKRGGVTERDSERSTAREARDGTK